MAQQGRSAAPSASGPSPANAPGAVPVGPVPHGEEKEAVMPSVYSLRQRTRLGGLCFFISFLPRVPYACVQGVFSDHVSVISAARSKAKSVFRNKAQVFSEDES